jgi:hypothetical protein
VGLAPTPACLLAPQLFTPHPMHTSLTDHVRQLGPRLSVTSSPTHSRCTLRLLSVSSLNHRPTLVALFTCFLSLTASPTHPPPTGLTPRICNELFQRIAENKDPNVKFRVECSYMEIYNERVRDLLAMSDKKVRFYFIYLFVCLFIHLSM